MADLIDGAAAAADDDAGAGGAPWHFWAVATVGLLWNSFGAVDYTLTQFRVPSWIGQVPPEILAKLDAAPLWATACWALGVWGSFVGAVLLILRKRQATTAFAVSLGAAVISFSWQWAAGLVATPVLPAFILSVVLFFWWYAGRMRESGVLA